MTRRALALLALCTSLTAPAWAQTPTQPRVTDQERDALGTALSRSDVAGVRNVVGPYVLLSVPRSINFERSTPEALVEATRGCRLFEAARIGDDPAMWYRFACPNRPRGDIRAWEDPGVYVKLWHHPAGVLAAYFYPGPVEVRARPRTNYLPAPPAPPRRPNP